MQVPSQTCVTYVGAAYSWVIFVGANIRDKSSKARIINFRGFKFRDRTTYVPVPSAR